MTDLDRLTAMADIQQLKACYFRGVDTSDGDLVRSILAEDCVLDFRGCCTDPASGNDFIPAMNVVLRGRASWVADGLSKMGIVSVHQGHNFEITFSGGTEARGIWSMTDRLYFPPGGAFSCMTGFGHYHDSYVKTGGGWKLQTSRLSRIRVEAS